MHLDMFSIEIFLAVCEEGSFSRAARRFFLSEPAVSGRIKSLEGDLGFALFLRNSRGVQLTSGGAVFRARATEAVEMLRDALVDSRAVAQHHTLPLTVWASSTMLTHLLPCVLSSLAQSHPDLEIVARGTGKPEQALKDLLAGDIDCVITHEVGRLQLDGYEKVELHRNCIGLIVAPDHPLAQHSRILPGDLPMYRLLQYPQPRGYWLLVEQVVKQSGLLFTNVLTVESFGGLKELTKHQHGIAFLPLSTVLDEVRRRVLLFRPVQLGPSCFLELRAWLYYPTNRVPNRVPRQHLDDFADVVRQCASELQAELQSALTAAKGVVDFAPETLDTVHLVHAPPRT